MAEQHKTEQHHTALFVIGAVVVGGAVLLFVHPSIGGSSSKSKPPKPGYSEGFLQTIAQDQSAIDTAAMQERSQNVQTAYNYAGVRNSNAAQIKETSIQSKTAITLGQIEQSISQAQDAAMIQEQQIQASAAQSIAQSQQPQWWQYLLGGLGSIGSWFSGGFGGLFSGLFGGAGGSVPSGGAPPPYYG